MFENEAECSCQDCLKRNPIFNTLNFSQIEQVSLTKFTTKYKPGQTIFKQGTILTHILSLTGGLAKISIEGYNDRNLLLKIAKAGEFIGGPGLFTDKKMHYTVTALTECYGCFIDVQTIYDLIGENKDFTISLFSHVNRSAIYNFNRFIALTQKQMQGRIADALIYLSKEIYQTTKFTMDISRQDLADLTAMSKESAIRILKEFKDGQIISLHGNDIEILKPDKLNMISMTG
ncbi:MAG TPA: Crp/Fnr family transcriptional regulator [Bacteroidia bacterium]|nr:Crp/Fnr family transcriptional regulator [Bacteroidia bacterium]HRS57752.1 Crp/Fnr family transcriptional regulator [Bacteroidia bacterium]HRU67307.1 Crp/Fnr family transcriptional regulator [Bacteroidia bacterium]